MEYYSIIKQNEIMTFMVNYHTNWNKSEKDQYHMTQLTCGI